MSRQVFTRDATGLVRELGFLDNLIISLGCINIIGGFVLSVLGAAFFFPGANLIGVFALGAVPALAFVGMYSILSAAMPRSGGDYVWTGRILGPRFGTVMAVLFLASQIIAFNALNAWAIPYIGLAQGFFALGLTTGNPTLVAWGTAIIQPLPGFTISLIIILFEMLVAILGVSVYRKVNRVSFAIYAIILVLFVVSLLSVSPAEFQSSITQSLAAYNVTYSSVQSAVTQNPQLASFSLWHTLLAFPLLGFLTYSGFNFSTYVAGETRNVSKSIPRSLGLAVGITAVFLVVLSALVYNLMGAYFVDGISYLFNTGSLGTLPVEPTATFLLSLAVNPWIGFALNLGVALGCFLVLLQCIVMFTRIIFALAFDRIIPTRFADVGERFHSPHYAALVIGILSIMAAWLYWYGPGLITGYLNSAIAVEVAYMIPGIGAFLCPFIKKDMYQKLVKPLPGWLSAEIGGWPLVSICGLAVAVLWGFGIYTELVPVTAYTYLGSSLGFAALFTAVPIIFALILFQAAKMYQAKRGLDIMMIFKEVPPE
ncbi:MAG: APC family permease [Candidatus Bathyarchaeia archaeon]